MIDKGELDPEAGGDMASDWGMKCARGEDGVDGHLLLVFSRLSASTRQSPRGHGQRARREGQTGEGGSIWGYKTAC